MTTRQMFEILGFVRAGFIVLSFALDGERRIRTANLIGCIFSIIYGFLIHSPSIVVLDTIVAGIQIYKLWKLRVGHE